MASRGENDRGLHPYPQGQLGSPFLEGELFADEPETDWESRLAALEAESPFERAFERAPTAPLEPQEPGEELLEGGLGAGEGALPMERSEAFDEETSSDLERGPDEGYYEDEDPYAEGETGDGKALPRMKFEFQTRNLVWRNDGKGSSLLGRKYGPSDFLVDKKGVRLESETGGVLEFETEWFRKWPKLEKAIKTAVAMTAEMSSADPSKYDATRKAFPFDIDHLHKGTAKEKAQGFWDRRAGMEGSRKKILGPKELLEVEIVDPSWTAAIQSSESILLEYYEPYLRQHEVTAITDSTVEHAKAILVATNTGGLSAMETSKLRSFVQIIVNYIRRGMRVDVKGEPAKFAFRLMCRTNFASIYRSLLTEKEKKLFQKMVNSDLILKEMGLDRSSPVFRNGYGRDRPEPGPTVFQWLSQIPRGVDLLSARSGKGLSAAMGRYDVETRTGKKDRWLVKFETRGTIMGRVKKAEDWVDYASSLFDLASNRERDALTFAQQQGVTGENDLTSFVFHARHPELRGRRIRKGEGGLAEEWLQIRSDLVRPSLSGAQPELEESEGAEDRDEPRYNADPDMEEYPADKEDEDEDRRDPETSLDKDRLADEWPSQASGDENGADEGARPERSSPND
jgi:hypothetical protein